MFKTLRSQLLGVAAVAVLVAMVGMMWFTYHHLRETAEQDVKDFIRADARFIRAEINSQFNSLLSSKANGVRNIKEDLRNAAWSWVREGIGKSDKETDVCQNLLSSDSKKKKITLLLLDQQGKVQCSSDPVFEGSDSDSFIGLNNKPLVSDLSDFTVFRLNSPKKTHNQEENPWQLGYFIQLQKNKKVLCAVTDSSYFSRKEKDKKGEIFEELRSCLALEKEEEKKGEVLLSGGFVFIFDNKSGEILVQPSKKFEQLLTQNTGKENKKQLDKTLNLPQPIGDSFVYTEEFKGLDCSFSIIVPETVVREQAVKLTRKQMAVAIAAFAFCFLLLAVLLSRALRPFELLSQKIEQVPAYDFTGDDQAVLLDGLPLSSNNEIGNLAKSFAFMVEELSDSIKQLVATTAANERIESELNIAREIQLGTLPKDFSFEPERKALEIYAYLVPALEVGGDLYDFFFIDDDHLCFTVGDVAGKGVPAALFMVITKKLISSNARLGCSGSRTPAEIMNTINGLLCKENPSAMFVTLLIGILDVKTGELRYANGGHVPPIFSPCGAAPAYRKDLSGPVVGVIPGVTYQDLTVVLEPGSAVFLCTDGVTEAMNEEDELFGEKRLLEEFTRLQGAACRQAVDGLLSAVRVHAGTALQSDDIAMLMIRWGVEEDKTTNSQST